MDNENSTPSTYTIRFCGSCGKEIITDCPYCPHCGEKISPVTNNNSRLIKKKTIIITLISLFLILTIIMGIIIGSKISLNPNNNSTTFNSNPLGLTKKRTAHEYVNEVLLNEYQPIKNELVLDYKYIDGEAYIDCSGFEGILLGYTIEDFNNDGDDDIYALSIKKDFDTKRDDNYSQCVFDSSVYLANDNGSFNQLTSTTYPLYTSYLNDSTLSDYYKKSYYYAVYQTSTSDWYILSSSLVEDERNLYKTGGTYYSIENSAGFHSTSLYINQISNSGLTDVLYAHRSISHIDGMPEAEGYDYYLGESHNSYKNLISGGINCVITGDGYSTPELRGEITGPCASESSACKKINTELDKYELQNYHLSTFKWKNRFDNSFALDESFPNTISFETSTIVKEKDSGSFHIKIK